MKTFIQRQLPHTGWLLLLPILLLLHTGCEKPCKAECETDFLYPKTVGFTPQELDTVILKQVSGGETIDSVIVGFDPSRIAIDPNLVRGDTINFLSSILFEVPTGTDLLNRFMRPGAEWEVTIPATGSSFRVSGITESGHVSEEYDCGRDTRRCVNTISAYQLNGTVITPSASASTVYLVK